MKHPHAEFLKALAENDLDCVEWTVGSIWTKASVQMPAYVNNLNPVTEYKFRIVDPEPQMGQWVYDKLVPLHANKAPKKDEMYFVFDPTSERGYKNYLWQNNPTDLRCLNNCLVYLSAADVRKRVESFRAGVWVQKK